MDYVKTWIGSQTVHIVTDGVALCHVQIPVRYYQLRHKLIVDGPATCSRCITIVKLEAAKYDHIRLRSAEKGKGKGKWRREKDKASGSRGIGGKS